MSLPSIQTLPHRDADQEAALWQAARQGVHAKNHEALFSFYAPFARSLARKAFRQRARADVEKGDFDQLAYEALLEAIGRFDPDRGVPFQAFAAPRIMGNIADGIARMTEIRGQLSWRHRMRRERIGSLAPEHDTLSTHDALAALGEVALGLALGFMIEGTGQFASDIGDEDAGATSPSSFSAFDSLAWKELVTLLDQELSALDQRDRTMLQLHYIQGMAFDQIATLLALSKGRISQLHRAALARLCKRMTARGHFRLEQ